MKHLVFVMLLVLTVSLLAGCSGQKTSSVLDKIKTSGKVVVGTSADYAPYEDVDEAGKFTGFDIELMTEIARRMGVELVWTDMLLRQPDCQAVQEGKIDMSISFQLHRRARRAGGLFRCITPGRRLPGHGCFHWNDYRSAGSGKVQNWRAIRHRAGRLVTTELVGAGLMPESQLSRYERVDQASLDLKSGRIDVLVADLVPAKAIMRRRNRPQRRLRRHALHRPDQHRPPQWGHRPAG